MGRPISTMTHGIIDMAVGSTMLVAPKLIGASAQPRGARLVPRLFGAATLAYNDFTNYEFGIRPKLSMRTHRKLDIIAGAVLAASPFIFRFARRKRLRSWLPHVIAGSARVVTAALTKERPGSRRLLPQV